MALELGEQNLLESALQPALHSSVNWPELSGVLPSSSWHCFTLWRLLCVPQSPSASTAPQPPKEFLSLFMVGCYWKEPAQHACVKEEWGVRKGYREEFASLSETEVVGQDFLSGSFSSYLCQCLRFTDG